MFDFDGPQFIATGLFCASYPYQDSIRFENDDHVTVNDTRMPWKGQYELTGDGGFGEYALAWQRSDGSSTANDIEPEMPQYPSSHSIASKLEVTITNVRSDQNFSSHAFYPSLCSL